MNESLEKSDSRHCEIGVQKRHILVSLLHPNKVLQVQTNSFGMNSMDGVVQTLYFCRESAFLVDWILDRYRSGAAQLRSFILMKVYPEVLS
jgi:hypothetical protein